MVDASPLPLDTSPLRLAAARALPLNRRGRASATDASLGPRADRTLARWRAQRPFDQDGWFERRLAADALDPRLLRGLLTEPPDALVGRLGTPEPWVRHLAATFACPPPAALAIPYQDAFATVAAPLLTAARDRLRQGIADLGPTPLGTPEEITAHLVPSLTASAHAMAVRTMIVELHAARLTGQLTGATPQDRYRDFLRRLADPAQALRLLAEYPVLARRLTVAAGQWTDTHLTLVRRLAADLPALSRTFAAGAPLGPLIEIRNGLGDAHRGGATVTALRFHGGTHLVYKPRPTDVDQHFQDLLHWLNPRLRLPLLEVAHLPGDGYGWTAHVAARPCRTPAELRAFYHRAGVLAALLYVLEAVDCHAQNLIAVGDQPVLVDLEALFHPVLREPAKSLSPSERLARHDAAHSVLRSGLLPQRMWDEDGNGGADVSALGWDPARLPPRTVPQVAEDGTDRMHIVYRPMALKAAASRPVPPDQLLHLADFADDLDAGFTEAYTLLARDKPHVRRLLRAFATDHTRLLLRDTLEYRSLLAAAHHPDLLRDALDHDRHLDRLWALAAWEDSAEAFLVHERADLWNNDIPLFTVRPDSVDVHASTGALIPAVTDRPALDAALDKLHALGPHDLARQRQLLRLSVTTAAGASEPHHPPAPLTLRPPPTAPDPTALLTRALTAAAQAADHLLHQAYHGPADLAWIGPNWTPPGRWAPAELGPDLYSGTAGITFFLHHLARLTGDAAHETAAQAAGVTLRLQIWRRADRLTGGLTGIGGILYALAHLTAHCPDTELDALGATLVARAAATAGDDTAFDLIDGCAGTIAGLAAWAAVRPAAAVTDALARCADRLVDQARLQPGGGTGWLPQSLADTAGRPLAGFAHGASGIAWALTRAGTLLGDERLPTLARAALDYEHTLFDADAANWRDVRQDGSPHGPSYPVLWCHGAAGIALARGELRGQLDHPRLREEHTVALATVARVGFGHNFSLCHGDLGNLEALLLAGGTARNTALRQAAATLDALEERGWVCGMPDGVHSPSLMVGVAGIGYGLLRLAAPDTTPSLLALHPPLLAPPIAER
ncbi:type 2 lanthipeptide synthetase LanM family protein [Streptomyces acidicola]|uniref:type 2 lanthipeptide synthetase LanM family protein n=1 Tax=Streptomyces acidicola TaxID=2596892 RepID=UPI00381807BD